jgi:apolipoprotein D and lipocalin family protein
MQTVSFVDIKKFMGDWHVVANIPTFPERGAIGPIERYSLNEDGSIDTTFSFIHPTKRVEREFKSTAFVEPDSNNAVWGMQFIWPIKADYRVLFVDQEYETTIVGRQKRDYLWIMSRSVDISRERLESLIERAVSAGYDREAIQIPARRESLLKAG